MIALPILAGTAEPQQRDWRDREFGIGVVSYAAMSSYSARDVIRTGPSARADTVAVLDRDSLCFRPTGGCVRSYERMIEFDYEIGGWAILGFSPDSGWARVTLAPYDSAAPVGWVRLRGDSVRAVLWSEILPARPLFFLHERDIAFYRRPLGASPVRERLVSSTLAQRQDYLMQPLEARGPWLRVELSVPNPMCASPEPQVRKDTVWIRYLTEQRRPRVFYYTRGC